MQRQQRTTGWMKAAMAIWVVSLSLMWGSEGFAQSFVTDVTITTGDGPTVNLNQDNTLALGAQNWSLTGDETAVYLDDNTGGQTPLTVFKGAPDDSLTVASNGRVGIGTSAPSGRLHVVDNVNSTSFIWAENPFVGTGAAAVLRAQAGATVLNFQAHASARTITRFGLTLGGWSELLAVGGNGLVMGTASNLPVIIGANNVQRILANAAGVTVFGTFTNSSSREYKEGIEAVASDEARTALAGLRPVKFKYKGDAEENLGFIAEEVPDLVSVMGRKSIAPMDIVAVLTKVVQEQQQKIAEQGQMLEEQRLLLKTQQLQWEESLKALQERVATVEQQPARQSARAE
jgi:Chaperone of endosialidase